MKRLKKLLLRTHSITPYFVSSLIFYLITFGWLLTTSAIDFDLKHAIDIVGYSVYLLIAVIFLQVALIFCAKKIHSKGLGIVSIFITLAILICGIMNVSVIEFSKTYASPVFIKGQMIKTPTVCNQKTHPDRYYLVSFVTSERKDTSATVFCAASASDLFVFSSTDVVFVEE